MTQHRFAVGVLALCALAGLAGCGGGDDDSDAAAQTAAEADVEEDDAGRRRRDDVEATVAGADIAADDRRGQHPHRLR